MSIVTFANGKSVNFNGNPTPQDIDYVAQQLGITSSTQSQAPTSNSQPAATPSPKGSSLLDKMPGYSLLSSAANSIVQPGVNAAMKFVRTGAGVVGGILGLGTAAAGKLTGNKGLEQGGMQFAQNELNPNIGVGGQPITPANQATAGAPITSTKQAIGTGLTLGSYLAGGEDVGAMAGEDAAAQATKEAPSVGSKIITAAKGGALVGGAAGGGQGVNSNASAGQTALDTGLGILGGGIVGAGTEGVLNAGDLKDSITDVAGKLINGKSPEEVLATPASDVSKLSTAEQKYWFDDAQNKINTAKTTADEQAKTDFENAKDQTSKTLAAKNQQVEEDLQSKVTEGQAQATALKRQLAVASRDETVELRPKIRSAMATQSQTYRALVDKALAPVADTPVSATELQQYVQSRFGDNPGLAEAINGRLGLTGDNVAAPLESGELPTTQVGEPIAHGGQFNTSSADTTIGKLYQQTKTLGQSIGTAANKSSRSFTPDEKLTDDAISTLLDFMKGKGVDLSEPNAFWAKYAPIRNQLVSEAKPFLQTPINTKTFANTLTRIAQGTDVNNENFIGAVEDLLGQPLATEQKTIVESLNANEKQAMVDQISAEMKKNANQSEASAATESAESTKTSKLSDNKSSANAATRELKKNQFEATQKAQMRSIIKKVITTLAVGGAGVAAEQYVSHLIGSGISSQQSQ